MKRKQHPWHKALGLLFAAMLAVASAQSVAENASKPLVIQEQGSFAAGGTVLKNPGTFDPYNPTPDGQTFHGDHLYTFYQIPVNARKLPLVMWHGGGQFTKTWETTPDGREGFQNIFLRRGYGVYLIDQPRRGDAGNSTVPTTIIPNATELQTYAVFRLGIWPDYFPGVQFSKDPEALNQFFRQGTPNTGAFDIEVLSDAVAALYDKIGPGILITHSQSGGPGWLSAIKSKKIRAIVSYEPGSNVEVNANFVWPEGEMPAPMTSAFNATSQPAGYAVPLKEFKQLTKIPIVLYFGDNIPEEPTDDPTDIWRVRLELARQWADKVNAYGGDVTVVHLPEMGIKGNTHFPFSDLNNLEIADVLSNWFEAKGLGTR